ncbi:MAG: TonB family protein [Kiritimatiellae bacterium]|nr:TonB family protein [Kiritimatiellia bacterium]
MNRARTNGKRVEKRAARWALVLTALLHAALAAAVSPLVRGCSRCDAGMGRAAVTLDVLQVALEARTEQAAPPAGAGADRAASAHELEQAEARVAQDETGPDLPAESRDLLAGERSATSAEQTALARLRTLIEREKHYPEAARRAGYTGEVIMLVAIAQDGTVGVSEVELHAGHALLEQAAARTMKRVAGRRLGVTLPEDIRVRVPIRFEIEATPSGMWN